MFFRVEAHHFGGNVFCRFEKLEEAQKRYEELSKECELISKEKCSGEATVILSIVLESKSFGE